MNDALMESVDRIREAAITMRLGRMPSNFTHLDDYLASCHDLLFRGEEELWSAVAALRDHAAAYANLKSPAMRPACDGLEWPSKHDLLEKRGWYVDGVPGFANRTSGTTGEPFEYLISSQYYDKLERDHHYGAVLKEFGLTTVGLRVVHVLNGDMGKTYSGTTCRTSKDGSGPMWTHGAASADVLHVKFPGSIYSDLDAYLTALLSSFRAPVDVLCCGGEFARLLLRGVQSGVVPGKLATLLSVTSSPAVKADLDGLVAAGTFSSWCDHMRSWDGGATFMTCKFGVYHLLDHVCWVESPGGELASTDYFNLSSPFVRYRNGDRCEVGDVYNRCECGRLYRPFRFVKQRGFAFKGRSGALLDSGELERRLSLLSDLPIDAVNVGDGVIDLVSGEIDDRVMDDIREALPDFSVRFRQHLSNRNMAIYGTELEPKMQLMSGTLPPPPPPPTTGGISGSSTNPHSKDGPSSNFASDAP